MLSIQDLFVLIVLILSNFSSGSVELAAVGVSVSVFNLVSKLFNIPLLNVTTSFVAEQQALDGGLKSDATRVETSI